MRRWIKRLTFLAVIIMAVGGGVAYWLVQQTRQVPEFYTRATQRLSQHTAQASQSLTEDVRRLQEDAAKEGSWYAEFSDDEVNAWLVEELPKKFPQLLAHGAGDPRIVIENDRILAAVRYKNRRIDTIVSCEVEVALTEEPNMLALKVSGLKAGALPLPLNKFLNGISKEAASGGIDVRWDMHEAGPIALVTVPSEHPRYAISPVMVESVELVDGHLKLSGHTGPKATQSYRPQGPVYRFVSYRPGANRSFQSVRVSLKGSSAAGLR